MPELVEGRGGFRRDSARFGFDRLSHRYALFGQFAAWATDVMVRRDPDYLPGYNYVQYLPDGQTIVHQHTFPVNL